MTPLVSFFVQAYNTERWSRECLESILVQRGEYPVEIIVIDDASKDGTASIVRSFSDSRLRFVHHAKNVGAIATANEGYAACRGKYIIRVDSDDRLGPQFLERTVPILEHYPRVGLVYGDIATMDSEGRVTAVGKMVRRDDRAPIGDEFFPLLMDNFIPAPTTLVRHEALLPLLPIPSELSFLDWYITTGVTERWETAFVGEVLADYRVHPTNMHATMIRDRSGEKTILKILGALFANGHRVEEKRQWQRRVYARNFVVCGDQYFGAEMSADARRCYKAAIVKQPSLALHSGIIRRLLATYVRRRWYDAAKRLVGAQGRLP